MKLFAVSEHKVDPIDEALAASIANTLEEHYPGWAWRVFVDSEGGIVTIDSGVISAEMPKAYGYYCRIQAFQGTHDMLRLKAIRIGGEILERASMARGKYRDNSHEIVRIDGVAEHEQPLRIF